MCNNMTYLSQRKGTWNSKSTNEKLNKFDDRVDGFETTEGLHRDTWNNFRGIMLNYKIQFHIYSLNQ